MLLGFLFLSVQKIEDYTINRSNTITHNYNSNHGSKH